MKPLDINDHRIEQTLSNWFEQGLPLFLDLYTPKSGGGGIGYLIENINSYLTVISEAKTNDIITIFKDSIVAEIEYNQIFREKLKQILNVEKDWFITSATYPKDLTEEVASGNNLEEVIHDIEDSCLRKEEKLFIGTYPSCPNYWEKNEDSTVIIIKNEKKQNKKEE